ncbi:hypothetical protein XA68_17429 [Ophiocordyceps unilateralis]|uniref:Uncharacterized protein n=1 Tax=Ophiocordyceps unilateralis TaxID=268505 RepID=A0A2A9P409_OPHUN|nr:hypothetical protein XA68_17429 [Ophiocordyceps unilateralis]
MDSPPFTAEEKRFMLGEMIKSSAVDIDNLIYFVHASSISPNWMHMQLPHGRNMSQCMQVAKQMSFHWVPLSTSSQGEAAPSHRGGLTASPEQDSASVPPAAMLDGANTKQLARIAPRPCNGSPALHGRDAPAASLDGGPKAKKKRGRPSRADMAKRDLKPNLPKRIAPRPLASMRDFHALQPAPDRPPHVPAEAVEAATTAATASASATVPAEDECTKDGKRRRIAESLASPG